MMFTNVEIKTMKIVRGGFHGSILTFSLMSRIKFFNVDEMYIELVFYIGSERAFIWY